MSKETFWAFVRMRNMFSVWYFWLNTWNNSNSYLRNQLCLELTNKVNCRYSDLLRGQTLMFCVQLWCNSKVWQDCVAVPHFGGMSNERYSTQSEFGHVTCNVFKEKSGHRRVFPFFGQVNCKWLKILHVNLHSTCCMRCAVLLAKVYSGWAMSAMFFDAPWHVNSVPRRWNFVRDHFNRTFGKLEPRLVLLLLVQMKVVCPPMLVGLW